MNTTTRQTNYATKLASRLMDRAWEEDVDEKSRLLLERAANVIQHQADALAAAGVTIRRPWRPGVAVRRTK